MGRTTWTDVNGTKKGEWTVEEDRKLAVYINEYGLGDWGSLPKRAGLQRHGKSCRLRWLNYLRPGIKRGKFTLQEEEKIIRLHSLLGNKWAAIAKQMANRTDNDVKNHWNSCLKKRLIRKGIDPKTHAPMGMTVEATRSSSMTPNPTPTPSHSSSSLTTSSSSLGSTRVLNKLASIISANGLERVKSVILSSSPNQESVKEDKTMISNEDEDVNNCAMDFERMFTTTTAFHESDSFVAFDPNYDHDYSSIAPSGLYEFDFLYDGSEQLDMFLL